jgi:predicted RecA/RadA family phage recombinase
MEPSAMHALFVAVELGEQLSKYSPCECDQLYTSLIYPVIVTDDTKVSAAARPSGFLWGIGDDEAKVSAPTIIGGVLGVYVANYSGPIEEIQVTTPPTIYSGSLVVQVIFYNNFVPDEAQVTTPPTIQSGSLVTQVIFYNNFVPDEVQVTTPPTIQSGSLT